MYCGAKECETGCPAYVYNDSLTLTCCALVNAQIAADKAKKGAYDAMKKKMEFKED